MATAKQIAARKLFAERARAGTLKKKRAKNPVKPKMDNNAKYPSGYSGAYPGRVKQVFSEGKKLYVILNDGSKHSVTYKDYGDEMPRVGDTFPGYNKNPIESGYENGDIVKFSPDVIKRSTAKQTKTARGVIVKNYGDTVAVDFQGTWFPNEENGSTIRHMPIKNIRLAQRASNPIAKKSLTARQYVTRPSQATKKPPSARLTTRRTKALKAPAGYFPNPILGFPFCVSAQAEGMNDFYKIAYFRDSETAVLFAKAYANLHQYLSIKVEAD